MILQDYKDSKLSQGVFDLQTVYLLSFLSETGDKKVLLVNEERKKKIGEKFKIESEHIYSIQSSSVPFNLKELDKVNKEIFDLNPFEATKFTSITNQMCSSKQNHLQKVENQDERLKLVKTVNFKQSNLTGWVKRKLSEIPCEKNSPPLPSCSFDQESDRRFSLFKKDKQTNMKQFLKPAQKKPKSKWMSDLIKEFEDMEERLLKEEKDDIEHQELWSSDDDEMFLDSRLFEAHKVTQATLEVEEKQFDNKEDEESEILIRKDDAEHHDLWSSDDEILLDPSLIRVQAESDVAFPPEENPKELCGHLKEFGVMDSDDDDDLLEASRMLDPPLGMKCNDL